jgi:hypothetical protein
VKGVQATLDQAAHNARNSLLYAAWRSSICCARASAAMP